MALGPRSAAGLCSASRAKRHSGSGPSAQTLAVSMAPAADQAHQIYAAMVQEASQRLAAASTYLLDFGSSQSLPTLESAILQVRKALEAIALASIAPNRNAYEEFRSRAEEQKDYTKD